MNTQFFAPATLPLLAFAGLLFTPSPSQAEDTEINTAFLALFAPLPEVAESADHQITDEKAALGHKLFFDKRFSIAQDISCASCHSLEGYGDDGRALMKGHKGQVGERNSPTVFNAALHLSQFWDGRAKDVEAQALGPVLSPVEMGMPSGDHVVQVIKSIPGYVKEFHKAFPGEEDPVTFENFGKAIGAYERKLLTPGPWDEFLNGDEDALTLEQKVGFNKFAETGCVTCHNGAPVGGQLYQKLGLVKPWPDLHDEGRSKITEDENDKFLFKVPSLRNIHETGPYLHDGSIEDLNTMVSKMAEHQLGRVLEAEEVDSIVAFLGALTGEKPAGLIQEPPLPASGPNTPKPGES